MIIVKESYLEEQTQDAGCGCDIYYGDGDCKHVDDGGCGCDD